MAPWVAPWWPSSATRVIRIEAPGGDWGRQRLPFSAHRTMVGSEDICLDLKTPEGQEIMGKLAVRGWPPFIGRHCPIGEAEDRLWQRVCSGVDAEGGRC